MKVMKDMTKCVESSVTSKIIEATDDVASYTKMRESIADHFENYTCADYDLPTTEPMSATSWFHREANYTVDILLDRPASKVHVIHDFITSEECAKMESTAERFLHSATVADGKGGSELSPNRKAMQAGITIPWEEESKGNPLTTISRRVYDYTNHVLDLDIKEHGQEDLMSIQYAGRGEEAITPDRYMPHCDGDCNGMDFRDGQRMASACRLCIFAFFFLSVSYRLRSFLF